MTHVCISVLRVREHFQLELVVSPRIIFSNVSNFNLTRFSELEEQLENDQSNENAQEEDGHDHETFITLRRDACVLAKDVEAIGDPGYDAIVTRVGQFADDGVKFFYSGRGIF